MRPSPPAGPAVLAHCGSRSPCSLWCRLPSLLRACRWPRPGFACGQHYRARKSLGMGQLLHGRRYLAPHSGAGQSGVLSGSLLHSDDVVLSADEKARLFASSHCAALDMESGFLARAADEAGLPFAVLRVVCDPATRSLPSIAGTVLSPDGGLKVGALTKSLLRHPGQIPGLIALGRDAGMARSAMQTFLNHQRAQPAFARLAA